MDFCSAEYLAVVGVVSAIVHTILRLLINMYPGTTTLLLNLMLLVNVLLFVFFGSCLYTLNNKTY